MNIDRMQGLIDLYVKAGKSRPAVETMAEFYQLTGRITQEEHTTVMAALNAQDEALHTVNLRQLLEGNVTAALETASAQLAMYQEALSRVGVDPAPEAVAAMLATGTVEAFPVAPPEEQNRTETVPAGAPPEEQKTDAVKQTARARRRPSEQLQG